MSRDSFIKLPLENINNLPRQKVLFMHQNDVENLTLNY